MLFSAALALQVRGPGSRGRAVSFLQRGNSFARSERALCIWICIYIHELRLKGESGWSPGDHQQLLSKATGNPETKEALGFENKRTDWGQPQSNGEHCEPCFKVSEMKVPHILPAETTNPRGSCLWVREGCLTHRCWTFLHATVGWEQGDEVGLYPYELGRSCSRSIRQKKGTKTHRLNHSCGERKEDGVSQPLSSGAWTVRRRAGVTHIAPTHRRLAVDSTDLQHDSCIPLQPLPSAAM